MMMQTNWSKYGAVTLGFVFLIAYVEAVADDFSPNDDSGNYVFVSYKSFDGKAMGKVMDACTIESAFGALPVDHFQFTACRYEPRVSLNSLLTSNAQTVPLYLTFTSLRL